MIRHKLIGMFDLLNAYMAGNDLFIFTDLFTGSLTKWFDNSIEVKTARSWRVNENK